MQSPTTLVTGPVQSASTAAAAPTQAAQAAGPAISAPAAGLVQLVSATGAVTAQQAGSLHSTVDSAKKKRKDSPASDGPADHCMKKKKKQKMNAGMAAASDLHGKPQGDAEAAPLKQRTGEVGVADQPAPVPQHHRASASALHERPTQSTAKGQAPAVKPATAGIAANSLPTQLSAKQPAKTAAAAAPAATADAPTLAAAAPAATGKNVLATTLTQQVTLCKPPKGPSDTGAPAAATAAAAAAAAARTAADVARVASRESVLGQKASRLPRAQSGPGSSSGSAALATACSQTGFMSKHAAHQQVSHNFCLMLR